MNNDELMDQLLKDAMAADVPQLSPAFDARIMERVRSRRLSPIGRAVIAAYAIVAVATAAWLMRSLAVDVVMIAVAVTLPVAIGASAYVRKLAHG